VATDQQIKASGIFRQTPLYCQRGKPDGGAYSVAENVAYNIKEYVPVRLPEPSRTDGRILWDSLIVNPFDNAAYLALADYLSENNLFPYAAESLGDRRGPADGYRDQPFWTRLCGWDGPGVLGCFSDGLVDAWLGSVAQFPQACRSGLFTEMPITSILIWDRQPLPADGWRGPLPDRRLVRWFGSELISDEYRQSWQCTVASVFIAFMREYHSAPAQGYIEEDSSRYVCYIHPAWATLALSQAMVNVGRYAAGLPILKFPTLDMNTRLGPKHYFIGESGLWWQKWSEWQTVYRNGVTVADGDFAASVVARGKLP
jgi:hypothetical protein